MTTVFLRFPDRATALAALAAADLTGRDPLTAEPILVEHRLGDGTRIDVDVVGGGTGVVLRRAGDDPAAPLEPLPGFHLNLFVHAGPIPDFGSAVVTPAEPSTVFVDAGPIAEGVPS